MPIQPIPIIAPKHIKISVSVKPRFVNINERLPHKNSIMDAAYFMDQETFPENLRSPKILFPQRAPALSHLDVTSPPHKSQAPSQSRA